MLYKDTCHGGFNETNLILVDISALFYISLVKVKRSLNWNKLWQPKLWNQPISYKHQNQSHFYQNIQVPLSNFTQGQAIALIS